MTFIGRFRFPFLIAEYSCLQVHLFVCHLVKVLKLLNLVFFVYHNIPSFRRAHFISGVSGLIGSHQQGISQSECGGLAWWVARITMCCSLLFK